MTYEEALDKVGKLLRLSTSSNPNEAALAASRAQEIMSRFKIDQAALAYDQNGKAEVREEIKDFGFDPIHRSNRLSRWRAALARHLARANACKLYMTGSNLCLVGRASDVGAVRYLFNWLEQQVEQLVQRDCRGCGFVYANNYRLGVVDTIDQKLREQKRHTEETVLDEAKAEQATNPMALIRVQSALRRVEQDVAEVEQWTQRHMRLVSRGYSYGGRTDLGARAHGQRAGQSIRMTQARGAIQ